MTEDGKKLKMLRKKRKAEPWCLLEGKREGGDQKYSVGMGCLGWEPGQFLASSRTQGRGDRQGCGQVGGWHLLTCGRFPMRASAFSFEEEAGSSAESEDGEKGWRFEERGKREWESRSLFTLLSLVPT